MHSVEQNAAIHVLEFMVFQDGDYSSCGGANLDTLTPRAPRASSVARSSASCNCCRAFSSEAASSKDRNVSGSQQATAIRPYGRGFLGLSHLCRSKTDGRQSAPTGTRGLPATDARAAAPTLAKKGGPPPSGFAVVSGLLVVNAVPPCKAGAKDRLVCVLEEVGQSLEEVAQGRWTGGGHLRAAQDRPRTARGPPAGNARPTERAQNWLLRPVDSFARKEP